MVRDDTQWQHVSKCPALSAVEIEPGYLSRRRAVPRCVSAAPHSETGKGDYPVYERRQRDPCAHAATRRQDRRGRHGDRQWRGSGQFGGRAVSGQVGRPQIVRLKAAATIGSSSSSAGEHSLIAIRFPSGRLRKRSSNLSSAALYSGHCSASSSTAASASILRRVSALSSNTFFSVSISSRARPEPSATQVSGSSAVETGSPVALRGEFF